MHLPIYVVHIHILCHLALEIWYTYIYFHLWHIAYDSAQKKFSTYSIILYVAWSQNDNLLFLKIANKCISNTFFESFKMKSLVEVFRESSQEWQQLCCSGMLYSRSRFGSGSNYGSDGKLNYIKNVIRLRQDFPSKEML